MSKETRDRMEFINKYIEHPRINPPYSIDDVLDAMYASWNACQAIASEREQRLVEAIKKLWDKRRVYIGARGTKFVEIGTTGKDIHNLNQALAEYHRLKGKKDG